MALTLSTKDKAIVKANPKATPLELLELGLSKYGYELLVKRKEEGEEEAPIATPTISPISTQTVEQSNANNKGSLEGVVTVVDTETGRETTMAKKFALLAIQGSKKYIIK